MNPYSQLTFVAITDFGLKRKKKNTSRVLFLELPRCELVLSAQMWEALQSMDIG